MDYSELFFNPLQCFVPVGSDVVPHWHHTNGSYKQGLQGDLFYLPVSGDRTSAVTAPWIRKSVVTSVYWSVYWCQVVVVVGLCAALT